MVLLLDFQKDPFSVTLDWFQGLVEMNQMLKFCPEFLETRDGGAFHSQ